MRSLGCLVSHPPEALSDAALIDAAAAKFLPDARPLNAEEEYRPLDAAAEPGILNNFPPWLPPPVRKSRRLPFSCGRSAA